jgi:hypothetical protein
MCMRDTLVTLPALVEICLLSEVNEIASPSKKFCSTKCIGMSHSLGGV